MNSLENNILLVLVVFIKESFIEDEFTYESPQFFKNIVFFKFPRKWPFTIRRRYLTNFAILILSGELSDFISISFEYDNLLISHEKSTKYVFSKLIVTILELKNCQLLWGLLLRLPKMFPKINFYIRLQYHRQSLLFDHVKRS